MKSIILNAVVFFVMLQHNVQAQPPVVVAPLNTITDLGSSAASGVQAAAYAVTIATQVAYNKNLTEFRKQWDNRATYRGGALLEGLKINPKLDSFKTRLEELETENVNISTFMYSRKKENTKLLADVRGQFELLDTEVRGQAKVNVILGEKMNLYQNMMKTITRLHRLLDIIELNIDDSIEMKTQFETMKNSPVPLTP